MRAFCRSVIGMIVCAWLGLCFEPVEFILQLCLAAFQCKKKLCMLGRESLTSDVAASGTLWKSHKAVLRLDSGNMADYNL